MMIITIIKHGTFIYELRIVLNTGATTLLLKTIEFEGD